MSELSNKDRRQIEKADRVASLMKHHGYADLLEEWEKIKQTCLKAFEDDEMTKEDLKEHQLIYRRILMWMDIPYKLIRDGENKNKEIEDHEAFVQEQEKRPLKGRFSIFSRK